ncbi:hypothetical protein OROMI_006275 [Orobanche minor]
MQSFSNEHIKWSEFRRIFTFSGPNFCNRKIVSESYEFLPQCSYIMNRTNFYRSAPTCDQRLFMQSFSNEQSPNGQNLGVFYGSIDSFRGPIFVTEKLFQNRTNFYHIAPPLI